MAEPMEERDYEPDFGDEVLGVMAIQEEEL